MADQRPSMLDPYRTLGLAPGTPMAEVKRAYRRLAKAYHPDSAGEAALPRFLAIHEAYEAIRTGRPMAPGRRATAPAGPEPWRADPDRARAAREQARRRAGTRPTGTSGTTGRTGAAGSTGSSGRTGTSGPSSGSGAAGGAGAAGGSSRTAGGAARGGRRSVRKATLGSTSYDEARDPTDPNDPTWSGASWYGPSSGEYWIINPREYADPRKHGPEYQSRARRMAADAALGELETDIDSEPPDVDPAEPVADRVGTAAPRAAAGPAFDTRTPGRRAATGRTEPVMARSARSARPTRSAFSTADGASWGAAFPAEGRAIRRGAPGRRNGWGTAPREWIGGASEDPIRRLGIALVAWPPIGLAAAALIGDVTGCSVYSADCGGTEPLLPWLAQAAILGLLLLLPALARLLAGGAIGVLVALVPITAFLVAVGGTGAPQAGFALSFLLALAWLAGIGWAFAQTRRRTVARARP